jgi:hypothetical protein
MLVTSLIEDQGHSRRNWTLCHTILGLVAKRRWRLKVPSRGGLLILIFGECFDLIEALPRACQIIA